MEGGCIKIIIYIPTRSWAGVQIDSFKIKRFLKATIIQFRRNVVEIIIRNTFARRGCAFVFFSFCVHAAARSLCLKVSINRVSFNRRGRAVVFCL